jgi:hypothetical protein
MIDSYSSLVKSIAILHKPSLTLINTDSRFAVLYVLSSIDILALNSERFAVQFSGVQTTGEFWLAILNDVIDPEWFQLEAWKMGEARKKFR